jgi:AraC-like DNA-binding protein
MDLVLLLAEDLAALIKHSAGTLKFTPDDIKSVQDALDLQSGFENAPLKLQELARKVNLHPRKLNAGFRLLKGKTSRTLAHEVMIEKAKKLLRETKMPVSEIAYEAGFCNSSAFIRAFKRCTGISPLAYRK